MIRKYRNVSGDFVSFEDIFARFEDFMNANTEKDYNLIVATDSLYKKHETMFSSVIILHRVGNGAIYFFDRVKVKFEHNVAKRMLNETGESVTRTYEFLEELKKTSLYDRINKVIIDLDVGNNGESKKVLKDCMSYVKSCGFEARVKPDAVGNKVADRHTR